jgi:hypothetical protein
MVDPHLVHALDGRGVAMGDVLRRLFAPDRRENVAESLRGFVSRTNWAVTM